MIGLSDAKLVIPFTQADRVMSELMGKHRWIRRQTEATTHRSLGVMLQMLQ